MTIDEILENHSFSYRFGDCNPYGEGYGCGLASGFGYFDALSLTSYGHGDGEAAESGDRFFTGGYKSP